MVTNWCEKNLYFLSKKSSSWVMFGSIDIMNQYKS